MGRRTVVRSGSIAASNFQTATKKYAAATSTTVDLDIQVIAQHPKAARKLTVQIARSGGPTTTATSDQIEQADQVTYYALTLPITRTGNYRLSMASGPDRGCFDVSFGR